MSLFGTMKTAVSGMNAQSNRLGTVGDNIANASTTGYKKSSTEFSSLVLPSTAGSYSSGGVTTNIRYSVSEQGNLAYTTSNTDLAIQGNGFFVVKGANGDTFLTRAGSFQRNAEGNLVNAAGFMLMGYSYDTGAPAAVVNGFDGLEPVNISKSDLIAKASTFGTFGANLNQKADIVGPLATPVATQTPDANVAASTYTHKSSLVAFDSLGSEVLYDFYYTKVDVNKWEVTAYRKDQATAGTGFPYTATAPATLVKQTVTLDFDPANGKLTAASPKSITINDSNSGVAQTININLAAMTQLNYDFTPGKATVDGNKANAIKDVSIDRDGTVYAIYGDGSRNPLYRVPLATVRSPDNLIVQTGNVYSQGNDSGVVITGFPNSGNFGAIISGALEESNVDMASELTEMIEAQRSYTANSKVFQTGSDLMDVLINLKR